MSVLRRIFLRLYNAISPGRAERQLSKEIAAHLALLERTTNNEQRATNNEQRTTTHYCCRSIVTGSILVARLAGR